MAKCDEGYRCEACGRDVGAVADSGLYLQYILGEVPLDRLHLCRERHVRCHPGLAQYIVAAGFEPVACPGPFDKADLDPEFVAGEELRVTRGWRRLQAVATLGLTIAEYPLSVTPDQEETP